MRYLKTLLVSLLAFIGTSAFAQTWTGSEAAAGTFYLYNVGTGKWLCGGNNWGTHASVDDYGIDFVLAGGNGAYTLDSQLDNGRNQHFLSGEWCDGSAMNWTFTQVKTEDGAIAYTIGNGQQVLSANTSDTNVNLTADQGALSQWILVSKDDIVQAALDAKATDVVDVTGFIIGQRTSRNNNRARITGDRQLSSINDVWKMERDADGRWCNFAMNGAGGTNDKATPYAIEAWNWKSFNFYQNISGVPNGKYTLHVNSFYRGYDGIRGYVYANDAMSQLTPETDVYKSYGVGNDLQNAAAAFFDGKYDNTVDVVVSNGTIRVGVKQTDAPNNDWMPFANFRLEYKGMTPLLKDKIAEAKALLPELDEQNTAALQKAIDAAQAVLDNTSATNSEIQAAIDALQETYDKCNALNIAKELAVDVLNHVPADLFPKNFFWYYEIDDKGKVNTKTKLDGIQTLELNRKYKVYKNNAGKYSLASRVAVAGLINLLEYADADAKTQKLINERIEALAEENENISFDNYQEALAEAITQWCRMVVESHGIGAALYEQNDPNYSRMYDALTAVGFNAWSLGYYWFYRLGIDVRDQLGADVTLSDTYEAISQFVGGGAMAYYTGNNYFGFNGDLTAHIADPDLAEGGDAWESTWSGILSSESLTDADGNTEYPYFDANTWNETGTMEVDAHQTIQLPAGRYMLTAAGRASSNSYIDHSATFGETAYRGSVWEGAFTEAGAQDPDNYFQLYATAAGVTVSQSFLELVGNKNGIFDNGWNDASVFFTMPSIGDVTIGVRAATNVKERWASATRFRLTRLGDATLYFDENETYDTELNWDPVNYFFGTAPTDVVLHKNLTAGKWQSIALPVDVSAQQLVNAFGEGTKLAIPSSVAVLDADARELIVDFTSWDVNTEKQGPIQTKFYGYYYPYYYEWFGMDPETYGFYDMPAGMIANVPYLIKPAKVSTSNLYVFNNVRSSETHGSKDVTPGEGVWSWGSFSISEKTDSYGWNTFTAYTTTDKLIRVDFVPNYTFSKEANENYTIEFSDRTKAFSAQFECEDGWSVGGAFVDGGYEILTSQLEDMLAIGKDRATWYPGLPKAMTDAMTEDPQVEGETGVYYFISNYDNGTIDADGKQWTSVDGKVTLSTEDGNIAYFEDGRTHFNVSNQVYDYYMYFYPGKYTLKTTDDSPLYTYALLYPYSFNDAKLTTADGFEYEVSNTNGYVDSNLQIYETKIFEPETSFTVEGGFGANFMFQTLYTMSYTDYSWEDAMAVWGAQKNVKNAIAEAKKAYPEAKAFHALYAQAEALLASDHVELVAGADNAFARLLPAYTTLFNRQTTAEGIKDITARLQTAIDDYLTKIKLGGIQEGKNYLRNVATGKYLGAANSWGTQASLVEHPEYVTLAKISDGVYTIESQVSNGGESYYLGNGGYMDSNPAYQFTMTAAGEYYTISCPEMGVIGYNGESTVLGQNLDAADENALWEVISEEDLLASLEEASEENPVDATFLILDPNFGRNNRNADAWVWETTNHNINGAVENYCAESWQAAFTLTQELNDVPNGVYVLTAQAAITDYTGAYDGADYPVVFANDATSKFVDMVEDDRATSMSKLSGSFLAGMYQVEPLVIKVEDGKISLGTRGTRTDTWCIWDNFALSFYGDADIEAVRASLNNAGGGVVDGINEVNAAEGKTVIYTVNGVRVNSISRPGIYIVNGKKVLVK